MPSWGMEFARGAEWHGESWGSSGHEKEGLRSQQCNVVGGHGVFVLAVPAAKVGLRSGTRPEPEADSITGTAELWPASRRGGPDRIVHARTTAQPDPGAAREKLRPIVTEEGEQLRLVRLEEHFTPDQKRQKSLEIREFFQPKIAAVLIPEQQEKFKKMQETSQGKHPEGAEKPVTPSPTSRNNLSGRLDPIMNHPNPPGSPRKVGGWCNQISSKPQAFQKRPSRRLPKFNDSIGMKARVLSFPGRLVSGIRVEGVFQ